MDPSPREKALKAVPLIAAGLIAAMCLIALADWAPDQSSELYLGASEEEAAGQAVRTAQAIWPEKVNASNSPVDSTIIDEVKAAEEEQAAEMKAEANFAAGKDNLVGKKADKAAAKKAHVTADESLGTQAKK